jgi:hypothetical protein
LAQVKADFQTEFLGESEKKLLNGFEKWPKAPLRKNDF